MNDGDIEARIRAAQHDLADRVDSTLGLADVKAAVARRYGPARSATRRFAPLIAAPAAVVIAVGIAIGIGTRTAPTPPAEQPGSVVTSTSHPSATAAPDTIPRPPAKRSPVPAPTASGPSSAAVGSARPPTAPLSLQPGGPPAIGPPVPPSPGLPNTPVPPSR